MAAAETTTTRSRLPSSSFLLLLFFFFILFFFPHASALSFDLPNIGPNNQNKEIITEGNGSYISVQGIQVTPDGIGSDRAQRAGRAVYFEPLHLWDNSSGELADFTTNFSFVIDSNGQSSYADGLTFFLARNNSDITPGGAMGLPVNGTTSVATAPFVAVEFDTFWNPGMDPLDASNTSIGDHVGIDVSSIRSAVFSKWWSNVTSGRLNEASIHYNSTSITLNVIYTGFPNGAIATFELNHTIDLRESLPEWVIFGFSAATGALFEKNNVRSWSFNSSVLQIDQKKSPTPKGNKNNTALTVGLSVGGLGLVMGIVLFGYIFRRKKREGEGEEDEFEVEMANEFEMGRGPKRFSYDELVRATNDFKEDKKLGEGGFGGVYQGTLREPNSQVVAIKRVSKSSRQGIKEYASEVRIISRLRHRNLVQLIGWCHEKRELLLVYEFMENGSLDLHLFKAKGLLNWETRYKIARGLASALLYLHEEWEQCVLHRDIKSSNVMLDSTYNAKLGDFGLAKLVDHEKGSQTTVLAGTMGYMAPESCITGKASKETDVFSFGVVALEIACGRKPIVFNASEGQIQLVEWVWELYGNGQLLDAVDPKLGAEFEEGEIERLMVVGLWCAHPDSNARPTIRQAIRVLSFEAPPPVLPSRMPVPMYFAPPASLSSMNGASFGENPTTTQQSSQSSNTGSSNLTSSSTASASASLLLAK